MIEVGLKHTSELTVHESVTPINSKEIIYHD